MHCASPFALPGFEVAAQQQLVHAQHAVQRRANFVAHGRQKLALGPAGGFRGLLGMLQIRRALGNLFLEAVALRGKMRVALLDVLEHSIEAPCEGIQFGNVAGCGPDAEIRLIGYMVRKRGQFGQRLQDRAVEPPYQRAAHRERDCRRNQRDEDLGAELLVQAFEIDSEKQGAWGLPVHQHRLSQVDVAGADRHVGGWGNQRRRRRRGTVAPVGCEQMSVPRVERANPRVRRIAQRLQQLLRCRCILEHQRRGGALGQHPGLHPRRVDQIVQSEREAAGNDDDGDHGHCRAQRNPVDVPQARAERYEGR